MGLEFQLDEPFFLGSSGTSSLVPGLYDVSIDGHPYMIDTTFEFGRRDSFRYTSIPAQRSATDIGNQPGENSINPQGLWRAETYDWSGGSGQRFYDRDGSLPTRFHHSQGIDPFTNKWYISLLPTTTQIVSSTDSQLQVLVVGSRIYKLTSTTLQYSTNGGGSWTSVTGMPASGLVMMCSDGFNVWIACGTNLLYTTASNASTASQYVTSGSAGSGIYFVAYCSNVLLVAQENSIYQIKSSGALPSALMTQNNAQWTWTAACGGYGWIYLAGYVGNYSTIYATANAADGTALTAPTISGPLPPGELCYTLFPFVNFVLVGTSNGVRFCITLGPEDAGGSPGDLKMGPLVPNLQEPVTLPVQAFTAQGRFVWFGWSNYDESTVNAYPSATDFTGLGRLDISTFTGDQTPAYCSDIMVSSVHGQITSMDWWPDATNSLVPGIAGAPIFVVNGEGIYTTGSTYVTSGFVQSGYVGFRIPDQKILLAYSVDTTNSSSEIGASINQDDEATYALGTQSNQNQNFFSVPQVFGELFETTLTLYSGNSNTTTPTVRRATLQAFPCITAGDDFVVALRFYDQVQTRDGSLRTVDVQAEYSFLRQLRANQTVIGYQDGNVTYSVVVDDIDMVWYQRSKLPTGGFNGTCMVTLKSATSGLIT